MAPPQRRRLRPRRICASLPLTPKMIIVVVFGLLVIAACTGVACTKKRALDPKDLQELFEAASFVRPSAADHGVVSGSFSTLVSGNE